MKFRNGRAYALYQVFILGLTRAEIMGGIAVLVLITSLGSVFLFLLRYNGGDADVRAVWLVLKERRHRQLAVMIAALGVRGSASTWPDLIVAGIMACAFLTSSMQILR